MSKKKHRSPGTGKEYLTCVRCTKQFFAHKADARKYCSHACANNANPKCAPVGDEKIKLTSNNYNAYTYVRTDNQRWKRKAIIVVEKAIGRKLKLSEQISIVHIDGNLLNDELSNLYLPTRRAVIAYPKCKKTRSVAMSVLKRIMKTTYCMKCALARRAITSQYRFTHDQIHCIRILVKYFSCRQVGEWFDAHPSSINAIKRKRSYKDVIMSKKTQSV